MSGIASVVVICIAVQLTYADLHNIDDDTHLSLLRAATWIGRTRNADFTWSHSGTQIAILGLTQQPSWNASLPENWVSVQKLDIDFLADRVRNQTLEPNRRMHLAQTLIALCRNPSDYYGFNLLDGLLDTNDTTSIFEYSLKMLTVCSGHGVIRKEHIKRLLTWLSTKFWKSRRDVDSLSMVILTAGCVGNRYGYPSMLAFANELMPNLLYLQSADGSFRGNVVSTSLAIQVLQMDGLRSDVNSSLPAATSWLKSVQSADGSYGDLLSTTEALLALSPFKGRSNLIIDRCNEHQVTQGHKTVLEPSEETIRVQLIMWIGWPVREDDRIELIASVNSTAFDVLEKAAKLDRRFRFNYRSYPFGHYVTSISNVTEDENSAWFLYILPSLDIQIGHVEPVSLRAFEANQSSSHVPISHGDHVLFWYRPIERH